MTTIMEVNKSFSVPAAAPPASSGTTAETNSAASNRTDVVGVATTTVTAITTTSHVAAAGPSEKEEEEEAAASTTTTSAAASMANDVDHGPSSPLLVVSTTTSPPSPLSLSNRIDPNSANNNDNNNGNNNDNNNNSTSNNGENGSCGYNNMEHDVATGQQPQPQPPKDTQIGWAVFRLVLCSIASYACPLLRLGYHVVWSTYGYCWRRVQTMNRLFKQMEEEYFSQLQDQEQEYQARLARQQVQLSYLEQPRGRRRQHIRRPEEHNRDDVEENRDGLESSLLPPLLQQSPAILRQHQPANSPTAVGVTTGRSSCICCWYDQMFPIAFRVAIACLGMAGMCVNIAPMNDNARMNEMVVVVLYITVAIALATQQERFYRQERQQRSRLRRRRQRQQEQADPIHHDDDWPDQGDHEEPLLHSSIPELTGTRVCGSCPISWGLRSISFACLAFGAVTAMIRYFGISDRIMNWIMGSTVH